MKPETLAKLEETASHAATRSYSAGEWACAAAWEALARFATEASLDLLKPTQPPAGSRQLTLTTEEVSLVCYALRELASRRREQAIDQREPLLAKESDKLRALAERIGSTP